MKPKLVEGEEVLEVPVSPANLHAGDIVVVKVPRELDAEGATRLRLDLVDTFGPRLASRVLVVPEGTELEVLRQDEAGEAHGTLDELGVPRGEGVDGDVDRVFTLAERIRLFWPRPARDYFGVPLTGGEEVLGDRGPATDGLMGRGPVKTRTLVD